jgi:hypothetical protein
MTAQPQHPQFSIYPTQISHPAAASCSLQAGRGSPRVRTDGRVRSGIVLLSTPSRFGYPGGISVSFSVHPPEVLPLPFCSPQVPVPWQEAATPRIAYQNPSAPSQGQFREMRIPGLASCSHAPLHLLTRRIKPDAPRNRHSRGSLRQARHPGRPAWFSRTSEPPCASAIWRLNARPMPEPWSFVV